MRRAIVVALLSLLTALGLTLRGQATSENVTVGGRTSSKILLSVDTSNVAFGALEPDVAAEEAPAYTATVKSNKTYLYSLSAPATFSGGTSPDINHMEWDRWGAAPNGYMPFWGGAVDTVLFEAKTVGKPYTYSLRLTFGYDEDPDIDYSAQLTTTALQW